MVYLSDSGQKLRVHDHPSDQSCHWAAVIVFHVPILIQSLAQRSTDNGKQMDVLNVSTEYSRWLCGYDEQGVLNLVNVLLHVCELRGVPNPANVACSI